MADKLDKDKQKQTVTEKAKIYVKLNDVGGIFNDPTQQICLTRGKNRVAYVLQTPNVRAGLKSGQLVNSNKEEHDKHKAEYEQAVNEHAANKEKSNNESLNAAASLGEQVKALKAENKTLKAAKTRNEKSIAALKENLTAAHSENEELKKQLEALKKGGE